MLNTEPLNVTNQQLFYSGPIPENYLQWKRVDAYAKNECCNDRRMVIYLVEEANLNQLLRDDAKKPSFEWAETFATLIGNDLHIYTNNQFNIESADLIYYRQPIKIQIEDCIDPYTGVVSLTNVQCEFKDDIIELLIDEAVSILAGDIESNNQFARGSANAEKNN